MAEEMFNDGNFKTEVLESDVPVLVDFWAPWCGPCRVQGPIIDELAGEMEGKAVKIGKLNVDDNPKTAQEFGIMSIPTIIIFENGIPAKQMTGVHGKEDLKTKIEAILK